MISKDLSFHLYLDNLFVSWKLCYFLLLKGIAITKTIRKGAIGYSPRLLALKAINTALKWGAIQADIVHGVLCWLWQDHGAVQGMTTGYTALEIVEKNRKKPKKTSTSASIARAPFGDAFTKVLPIPGIIDGYNNGMNMVDQANQLRSYFTSHPNRTQKEFFPGIYWSFDFILVNCFEIYKAIYPEFALNSKGNRDPDAHRRFLEKLVDEIFLYTDETFETRPKKSKNRYIYTPRGPGRLSKSSTISQN